MLSLLAMKVENFAEKIASTIGEHTENVGRIAAGLKAAGDPLRLQVLSVLASDSFGVLELCQIFDAKQSGMSHHLKVLSRAGFVDTRREGNTLFYRRSDALIGDTQKQLRNSIYAAAQSLPLNNEIEKNLAEVYGRRAEASRAFFRSHADAFKKQSELIASFDVYGPEVGKLLTRTNFNETKHALEIGPGVGEFLSSLSATFDQVTALDSSEPMLKQSQAHCIKEELDNIDFICGDTNECRNWQEHFDCAAINMVLHHTPSPQKIFQDVAFALKTNAVLLVSDLGAHDQDWVREACGDQWLGFNAEELKNWASNAQLKAGESRYLSLRNGFQIQIHQFIKK